MSFFFEQLARTTGLTKQQRAASTEDVPADVEELESVVEVVQDILPEAAASADDAVAVETSSAAPQSILAATAPAPPLPDSDSALPSKQDSIHEVESVSRVPAHPETDAPAHPETHPTTAETKSNQRASVNADVLDAVMRWIAAGPEQQDRTVAPASPAIQEAAVEKPSPATELTRTTPGPHRDVLIERIVEHSLSAPQHSPWTLSAPPLPTAAPAQAVPPKEEVYELRIGSINVLIDQKPPAPAPPQKRTVRPAPSPAEARRAPSVRRWGLLPN